MSASNEYISQQKAGRFHQQAVRVWGIGLFVVTAWISAIIAAPLAKAYGLTEISSSLYRFFGFMCHQIPDRSFHVLGEQFGVCSRCFGVYSGLVFGFLIFPLWRKLSDIEPLPRIWLFLSLIPISIDWSLTVFGIWENTHLSRFLTGLLLGTACATFIVPATVEITRNLTYRRRIAAISAE